MSALAADQETGPGGPGPSLERPNLSRLLLALLDRIECGLLVCTARGELLLANVAAQRELRDGKSLRAVDGVLRSTASARQAWSAALIEAVVRQRSSLVNLNDSTASLMVAVMPAGFDIAEEGAAVVIMGRRSVCSSLGLELLAGSHGLTPAESRVYRALIDNQTPRQIAALHGVGVTTIRTQIQTLRDKLSVRSIDALLLRAAEIPPVTALH